MIAMPLLTVFIAYMGLGAGYLCEMLGGNLSLRMYVTESLRLLTLRDSLTAVLKTVPFGFLIGVTGCYFGMTAHGGTEGVGNAATRSVVTSIFLVLVSNVVLVRLIQLLP
jgi:phospholipid/cholesterol/gamma-HCH transport system permease protein